MDKIYDGSLENPVDEYYTGKFPNQKQPYPGVEADINPVPATGAESQCVTHN